MEQRADQLPLLLQVPPRGALEPRRILELQPAPMLLGDRLLLRGPGLDRNLGRRPPPLLLALELRRQLLNGPACSSGRVALALA